MKKKVFLLEEVKRKLEQYCTYQDRCHNDVEKKLLEYTLIPEAKEQITLHLIQENFLNEERFAKSYALGKFKNNKWGKNKIKYHLHIKGVSLHNIQIGISQIEDEQYRKTIEDIVLKKATLIKEKNIFKKRVKISKYLFSKGFEIDVISNIILNLI